MSSGVLLFQRAEGFYAQGNTQEAFNYYQKAVKKILKDENPVAQVPFPTTGFPDTLPRHTLGLVWTNFVGFLRDPAMSFTPTSDPDAYKLLNSFRPSAAKSHTRLERTEGGKALLKGMQITAVLTLGLMAWDQRDRATAAKRYKEALDLAATHPPFADASLTTAGLERWVYEDVQQAKFNLDFLVRNDAVHAQALADGAHAGRKDIVQLPLPHMRIEKSGEAVLAGSVMLATDACATCGKRDVKLMRCSLCKKAQYCGPDCQRADWKAHKASSCVRKD
jgi:hypothetical protein